MASSGPTVVVKSPSLTYKNIFLPHALYIRYILRVYSYVPEYEQFIVAATTESPSPWLPTHALHTPLLSGAHPPRGTPPGPRPPPSPPRQGNRHRHWAIIYLTKLATANSIIIMPSTRRSQAGASASSHPPHATTKYSIPQFLFNLFFLLHFYSTVVLLLSQQPLAFWAVPRPQGGVHPVFPAARAFEFLSRNGFSTHSVPAAHRLSWEFSFLLLIMYVLRLFATEREGRQQTRVFFFCAGILLSIGGVWSHPLNHCWCCAHARP